MVLDRRGMGDILDAIELDSTRRPFTDTDGEAHLMHGHTHR